LADVPWPRAEHEASTKQAKRATDQAVRSDTARRQAQENTRKYLEVGGGVRVVVYISPLLRIRLTRTALKALHLVFNRGLNRMR
jgi:phosphoribosylformimino-5-aminoimidazole carboxamide ribonucleotide (ProFAR) isomerase